MERLFDFCRGQVQIFFIYIYSNLETCVSFLIVTYTGIDIQNEDQMNSLIHSSNYEYLVQTQHYLDK